MAYPAEEMRAWRIRTGRTKNLSIPVGVLSELLAHPDARLVLRKHLGLDLVLAIKKAPLVTKKQEGTQ